MDSIEKLAQLAKQQTFDDRSVQIFDSVYQDTGIADPAQTTTQQGDRLLSIFKESKTSPEFIKTMLIYSLQKGMPLYAIEHIMNSDQDRDGRTLSQELFQDNTDPFEVDTCQKPSQNFKNSRAIDLEL